MTILDALVRPAAATPSLDKFGAAELTRGIVVALVVAAARDQSLSVHVLAEQGGHR